MQSQGRPRAFTPADIFSARTGSPILGDTAAPPGKKQINLHCTRLNRIFATGSARKDGSCKARSSHEFHRHHLGSASAKPTPGRHPSAQVVNLHEQHYLVDAGEGTQQQLFRYGINPLRLRAVFLSHLHGDHCFGFFPLLSTLGLYGRRTPLPVYAPAPFGEILACHLRYFDSELPYAVEWHEVDTTKHRPLLENRSLEVWSIPLRHRVPTCGYLFREKEPPLNVDKFKITKYGLSIAQITAAKRGEAVRLDSGETLHNEELTYRPYKGAVVRLPVGHGLLGQGGGAGRRRRPALPRGDLPPPPSGRSPASGDTPRRPKPHGQPSAPGPDGS